MTGRTAPLAKPRAGDRDRRPMQAIAGTRPLPATLAPGALDSPGIPADAFQRIVSAALSTAGALDPRNIPAQAPNGWSVSELLDVAALGCAALRHPDCPSGLLIAAVLGDQSPGGWYRAAALGNPAAPDEVRVAAGLASLNTAPGLAQRSVGGTTAISLEPALAAAAASPPASPARAGSNTRKARA